MINIIQSPSTSNAYREYSHMMMYSEDMVVGDDVGGDGSGEDLESPLFGVESIINLTPKKNIVVMVALYFAKNSVLLAGLVFRVYKAVRERRRRGDARGTNGPWWRA
jgi:hypothetical protein